ncbi:hypothetical protein SPRG_19333 [Saprolegnia parasitica CBS 223.65]|uniref:Uncharacterized protein n=1 Tax=Saprolegnia parasitica (strain CBS 223.65) TaxID=695850 RepID=A0A067CSS2_SAPPC|nr:hypothetical protein SPRG_19333 [Saprolegnia parasitica CBS 223.65]KDO33724.1 hypothetical protein SPRG_19333 [Saprolegnia parasitica CBS 223.65]|eukprot:XP_012195744.1 hypothetical protein SPRG_19333 [Saprolegnia parasitica CBS 223.65]
MQDVDAGTEPYAAAHRLLVGGTSFTHYVCQGPLDPVDVPSLRVAGFDAALHRHSDSAPIASMLQGYSSGVVPAHDLQLGHGGQIPQERRDRLPATIEVVLNTKFYAYDLAPVLSHLAVGSASSMPLLTPAVRTMKSFGTLLVLLPTFSDGGLVTVTYKTYSTPLVTSSTSATFAVVHRSASVSMAPVTAGHVVVAVFDLVGQKPPQMGPPLSPAFEAAVAALIDVASAPPVAHNMIGFAVRRGLRFEGFSHCNPQDAAFLAALLESKAFDVAGVLVQPRLGNADAPHEIHSGTMHPALGLKPNVMAGCVGQEVPAFLGNVEADLLRDSEAKMCFVFWPTARRSCVLVFEGSATFLGVIADAGLRRRCLEHLLDDADGLVSSVICNEYMSDEICFSVGVGRHVNDIGDIDLVKRFWALRATVVCEDHLHLFAPTVHRALELFGVDALMPALEALLSSWQTTWAGFASGVRLVASLVGVSNEAVCLRLPLSAPHLPPFNELALRLYKALFPTPSPPKSPPLDLIEDYPPKQLFQAALVNAARLEAYLWGDPLHGMMLPEHAKLVYAYRPPSCLEALVVKEIAFHPWTVLAPVVLALAPTRVAWCDALLRANATTCEAAPFDVDAVELIDEEDKVVKVVASDAANVLCALDAMDALDLATLQRILAMARRTASKALWMFFNAVPAAAPRYLDLVLSRVVDPDAATLRDMVLNKKNYTIETLARWSPASLDPLHGLMSGRDNNPDLHRAFLHRRQRAATPFDRELALTTLRALEAEDYVVQNEPVAVDVDLEPCRRHCARCYTFRHFLCSPDEVTWNSSRPVCDPISRFATNHAHVIDMIYMYELTVVTKRLPQRERRDQGAIMMDWLQRRLAQDNDAHQCANTVDGNNTVDDADDEPAPKRVKAQ